MPELPEVETVCRGLRETIVDQTIETVTIKPTAQIYPSKTKFARLLRKATITTIDRRGKNILIRLSNDFTLWVHLKMTGHFYYLDDSHPTGKHDHVMFNFADNPLTLRFNDYRRFGRLRIFPTATVMQQPGLVELGPEPLEISVEEFIARTRRTSRMIKPALLDQSFLAGLGNIYADESLFLSKIHPKRLTDSIAPRKLRELHSHIQNLLNRSLELMGTSVDTFAGINGNPGEFQKYLLVYSRENQPCVVCSRPVIREKIGSRSAHFCRYCQRPPGVKKVAVSV